MKRNSLIVATFLLLSAINIYSQWKSTNLDSNSPINTLIIKDNMLIAGANDGIYISATTKDSWTKSNTGLNNLRIRKLFTINNTIYAGTENGVHLSVNNGSSWTSKGPSGGYYVYSFVYKNNTLYAGTNGGVIISTNNGNSWAASNTGLDWPRFGFAMTADQNNIILGESGKVYKSTFSNVSWSSISGSSYFSQISAIELNGNNIYVTSIYDSTNQGGFFYSPNYGVNWYKKIEGLSTNQINTVLVVNNNIFIGTDAGVYYSSNNGDNWIDISDGLSIKKVKSLTVSDNTIYVGTDGSGVWSRLLSEINTAVSEPFYNTDITLYPNPSTEYISVNSNFFSDSFEFRIYSITGELIKQDKNNFNNKIFIGDINSGIYYISIKVANDIYTKKIIVKQ